MYVEIGSLQSENVQQILDLTLLGQWRNTCMLKLYKIILNQAGIFCIVGELFCYKNNVNRIP